MILRQISSRARECASQLSKSTATTHLCFRYKGSARTGSFYDVSRSIYSSNNEQKTFRGDSGRRIYETNSEEPGPPGEDEREFIDMKVEDFHELYGDNEETKDFIKKVLAEYEMIKYETIGRVPSVMSIGDMKHFLEEGATVTARGKLFHYLFKREMAKRGTIRRKMREKKLRQIEKQNSGALNLNSLHRSGLLDENGDILYGLWHNSLFARIPESLIKNGLSMSRLRNASLFGRKVIFDLSYESYMNKMTTRNVIEQLQEGLGLNRFDYREPFDIWFCNYDESSYTAEFLSTNALKNLHSTSMVTTKPGCMTEYFDKSKLVYLSPNARDPLGQVVKSDDIYIIGAYNDRSTSMPLSLRIANKLGIRARRLPLDEHVLWKGPNKALCVNHVLGILLEVMSNGNDWKKAFLRHIPPRKLKSREQAEEEEAYRQAKLKNRLVMKHMSSIFSD